MAIDRHSLHTAPGTAGNFMMPSGKSLGWPPLSGGLKAREVYQLPLRKVREPGLEWKEMCASASFSDVKVLGSRPASVKLRTHLSVSTTRGSLHASLPLSSMS